MGRQTYRSGGPAQPLRRPLGRRVRQPVPETHFDPATLHRQLTTDGPTRYLWLLSDRVPQGFTELNRRSSLPTDPAQAGLEPEKIQFLKTATGQGYGSALMTEVIAQARCWAEPFVWLDVLKINGGGRRMYERRASESSGKFRFRPTNPTWECG